MRRITIAVLVTVVALASVVGTITGGTAFAEKNKVEVCHMHNGNHSGHTISINQKAVSAHLSHGDTLGACEFGYGYGHGKGR